MAEGIEKLSNLILLVTARPPATHSRVLARGQQGAWQVWREGAWHEEAPIERTLVLPVLRRYSVMMGSLFPGRDQVLTGRIQLDVGGTQLYFLLEIIHEDGVIGALIEAVDAETSAARAAPMLPLPHPYRT